MRSRWSMVCVLMMLPSACAPQSTSLNPVRPPLLYTLARQYEPLAWMDAGERFPAGATIFISDQKGKRSLIPGFAATADASVSFDGKTILFAGKRQEGDHWQIWEVAAAAPAKPRQITFCDDDCVRPLQVPPESFVYAHKLDGRFVLQIAGLNSSNQKPLQLTYAPGNFLPSDVLRDGRILFEAAQPPEDSPIPELYTIYTDGSGVESYRCDHGHARYAGKQISSGDVVFAREGKLARFTSALAHDVAVPAPAGAYAGDVVEIPEGTWLVTWRADGNKNKNYEVRRWKPGTATLRPVISEPASNVIQPALLRARPVPNRHPSGLHDWAYANVLCLNAYTSKYSFVRNSIASVRLYTRTQSGEAQLLGSSQVEEDGSFYLRVPGNQPLRVELLDRSGNSLKKEAGWFWMRSGEQRICVGCHAGPETAPDNAVPAVLLRSTIAADMTNSNQHSSAGGH